MADMVDGMMIDEVEEAEGGIRVPVVVDWSIAETEG